MLRHCDRRHTAEGASAREELRHARSFDTRGASAREELRHARCSGTATGDVQPKVLRHAKRCSGTATGDVQPKVLRHARSFDTRGAPALRPATYSRRCFGTRGASTREVLRHCDRRRTAERAPARETCSGTRNVLRHGTCFGTAIGDEQPNVLRHETCSGTATGDVQPNVLRHARRAPACETCSGTRRAPARDVLRHCDRRRTAERAPARETCSGTRNVLRHETCSGTGRASALRPATYSRMRFGTRGAPAPRGVLRHKRGASARDVLRHEMCFGTRETQGHATTGRDHGRLRTQRPGHQVEVFLRQFAGFLNTTGLLKAQAARPPQLRFSSGSLPVSSASRRTAEGHQHTALRTRPQKGKAIVRTWGCRR